MVAPDASGIARVVAELAAGSIVALPTETVYGLAADATNGRAVARIFEAKGRPRFNPLICHVDGLAMARANALFDPLSAMLADAFWPGPLTLVLPLRPDSKVHELVTAGLDTVAVRAPRGVARAVIARLGRPVAAPSANRSGAISPTTAAAVRESLGDAVPLICDGGPTGVGVESTIVRVHDGRIVCLRPGGLPLEQIEKVAGRPVARAGGDGAVTAPGMLASHYAPDMAVRLNVAELQPGEALLAFGPDRAARWQQAVAVENLSPAGDLAEAAANLFAMMHALDATGAACMAVEPIPDHGLGEAINDRLRRAAAPRPAP
ncbi:MULTISPECIES: L-threonylcarbamoyladenylate synthase [unclassified Roseitalea]|uniref:L-threonylcarbamoyladenylate synthase n=1 Tax=unclassified Roseitalea TaxID=2639107 RepID=UPI00273E9E58|nr:MULTISPECIES: L-threonylcarbamoyladenylate synthase [unclassified Roseitalea]